VQDHEENTMAILTVTARGQVTLRKEVLKHLGIKPGDKIEFDLLPNAQGLVRAAQPAASIGGFVGLLAGRTKKVATLEEMNEASAQGWSGGT
jgi:bifunctional DNA-binding transcriptional regulator/antitoxin component of YhaV-PrlF toxin-antitoxin module